uniref:Swi5-dependent recombination DNA repair protein 1 homolog n=1 Tax=Cacopsylla melanoneura TaxID=428564 RepID=A0A8D9FE16_9HEMI
MDHIAKLIKTDPKANHLQSPCSGRVSQSKFLSPCRRVGLKRNTAPNKFVLKFKQIDPLNVGNEIVEQETKRAQNENEKNMFTLKTAKDLDNNNCINDTSLETSNVGEFHSMTNNENLEIATSVRNTKYSVDKTNDFDNSGAPHSEEKINDNVKHNNGSVQEINIECSRRSIESFKSVQTSTLCKSNTNQVTKKNTGRNKAVSKNKTNHSSNTRYSNSSSPDMMKMKSNVNVQTNDCDQTTLQGVPNSVEICSNGENILENKCELKDVPNERDCKNNNMSINTVVKTDGLDILNDTNEEDNFSDDLKKDNFLETQSSLSNYYENNIPESIIPNCSSFCDNTNNSLVNEAFGNEENVSNSDSTHPNQMKQLKINSTSEVNKLFRIEENISNSHIITDTSYTKQGKRVTKRFKNPIKQLDVKKIKLDTDQTKAEGLSETDETQAVRLRDIRRRIAEKEKKIANMKSTIANSSRHNLDELDSLISKWRTGSQEALTELLAEIRRRGKDNYNMSNLLGELNIPHDLVRYNEVEEDFV